MLAPLALLATHRMPAWPRETPYTKIEVGPSERQSTRAMNIGHHLIFDSLVEDARILRDAKELETRFRRVFAAHRVSVLDFVSHTFLGHGGVTGVFLLAESHASYHTWPEHRLVCVDFFTCGDVDLIALSEMLVREMAGERISVQVVPRGLPELSRRLGPEHRGHAVMDP